MQATAQNRKETLFNEIKNQTRTSHKNLAHDRTLFTFCFVSSLDINITQDTFITRKIMTFSFHQIIIWAHFSGKWLKVSKFVPSIQGPSPAGTMADGSRFYWRHIPAGGNFIICSIFITLWGTNLTLSLTSLHNFQQKYKNCFRSKHPEMMMISNNNLDKSHHQPHHEEIWEERRKVDLCISSKPLLIPTAAELSLSPWRSA